MGWNCESALDGILNAYPELTREMVQAALEYAATVIDEGAGYRSCLKNFEGFCLTKIYRRPFQDG